MHYFNILPLLTPKGPLFEHLRWEWHLGDLMYDPELDMIKTAIIFACGKCNFCSCCNFDSNIIGLM
jgi:hypothetical protein